MGVSFVIFFNEFDFRQLQRKRRRPLLSLGTKSPDIYVVGNKGKIIPVRPYSRLLQPDIPFLAGTEPVFEILRGNIRFIGDHQLFPSAGKAVMDAADNPVQLLHKSNAPCNNFFPEFHQLNIPYIQRPPQGGIHVHILEQPVSLVYYFIIVVQVMQIHGIKLTKLHIHESAPFRRAIFNDTEILRGEKNNISSAPEALWPSSAFFRR